MKNYLKRLALLFTVTFLLLMACSKNEDETTNEPVPTASNFTVYKNQTNDINADALQAQNVDSKGTVNFYGVFDSNNNPTEIRTLTYQKVNNDTIVNLIIDPLTSRLAASYFSVKGIKSPIIMKFDYLENKDLNISFYKYDWNTNTSELIGANRLSVEKEITTKNFSFKTTGIPDWAFNLGAFGVAISSAEIVRAVGGGWSGIGALYGVSAGLVAGISAVAIVTVGTIVVLSALLYLMSGEGHAAELIPANVPYLTKTPIKNPVPKSDNPIPKLQTSSCFNTNITFEGSMGSSGDILISNVKGGVPPYSYLVGSGVQDNPVFPNKYKDGSYLIGVKGGDGCISVKVMPLKRELDPLVGTWELESCDGVPLGGWVYHYYEECPSILYSADLWYSSVLTLNQRSYRLKDNVKSIDYGIAYDEKCAITSDSPDLEETLVDNITEGARDKLSITLIDGDGLPYTSSINVINPNKISIDNYFIYVRK
jgi:hypothetical protein